MGIFNSQGWRIFMKTEHIAAACLATSCTGVVFAATFAILGLAKEQNAVRKEQNNSTIEYSLPSCPVPSSLENSRSTIAKALCP
jgi:hypothetical protein